MSAGQQASSVTRHGITWTFDTTYQVGQYVNGDWWVVGPVTINSVSPAWDGSKNGSVLDMGGEDVGQGFSNISGVNWSYASGLRATYPLAVDGDSIHSLISVIGRDTENNGGANQVLTDAAVLTIVPTAPAADAFRPAYMGTKTHYRWSNVLTNLLPDLALPSGATLPDTDSMDRVWLTALPGSDISLGRGYVGACIHPENNMPTYPRDSSLIVSQYACAAMVSSDDRDTYVKRLIQLGIDLYGINEDTVDPIWGGAGFGLGWKFPIIFAGVMLNDAGMKAPTSTATGGVPCFMEDSHTYMSAEYSPARPMWGAVAEHYGYAVNGFCFQNFDFRDPDELAEVQAPTGYPELYGTTSGGATVSGNYRDMGYVWTGQALAGRIMSMETVWDHDAWFDYLDRCVDDAVWSPSVWGDAFIQKMWETYRGSY